MSPWWLLPVALASFLAGLLTPFALLSWATREHEVREPWYE